MCIIFVPSYLFHYLLPLPSCHSHMSFTNPPTNWSLSLKTFPFLITFLFSCSLFNRIPLCSSLLVKAVLFTYVHRPLPPCQLYYLLLMTAHCFLWWFLLPMCWGRVKVEWQIHVPQLWSEVCGKEYPCLLFLSSTYSVFRKDIGCWSFGIKVEADYDVDSNCASSEMPALVDRVILGK